MKEVLVLQPITSMVGQKAWFYFNLLLANHKRRLKVAKYLESLGDRVQYSVFEVYLTQQELEKLMRKFNKLINAKEDSVRVYIQYEACRGKVGTLGRGEVTEPPGVVIV